jgi:SAM-dependent methyltransferase
MSFGMSFFRWKKAVDQQTPDLAASPDPDILPGYDEPDIIADKVNPWTGLTDSMMRGWFQNETGELFTGFPITAADTVADIGCGDGSNAAFCAKYGARIILADIDPACIDEATARVAKHKNPHPVETHVTNSDPIPIATGACTRIICTEVIEHVPSPEKLLAELVRIGAPGALYLISCPDPVIENIYKKVAHPSYFEAPNHLRILSHDDLTNSIQNAGLQIESRGSYGFYWAMWWTLFWACNASTENPRHPVLDNWARTWQGLITSPDGHKIKHALDDVMPKSQIVIARKAGGGGT